MANERLGIVFGAMADPLRIQLRGKIAHGGLGSRDLGHLQRDVDAISRLQVRGLISDAAAHAARQKVMKKIIALVAMREKP